MSEKRMFTLFQIRPNNLADFSRKLFSITFLQCCLIPLIQLFPRKKFHQIMKITVSHDAVTSHRLRRITLKLMLLGKTFKTQGETNCSAAVDILFPSNHNIHKSSCGHCFWASDPLIDRI